MGLKGTCASQEKMDLPSERISTGKSQGNWRAPNGGRYPAGVSDARAACGLLRYNKRMHR